MHSQTLPDWPRVLAVVAHPDDESFGLGALLAAFAEAGSSVSVFSFTKGEASSLGQESADLAARRTAEMAEAGQALGLATVQLGEYPDGHLSGVDLAELVTAVEALLPVDGLLVFDASGVTGHPDHCRATEAAIKLARAHHLPVLGWTLPESVARSLAAHYKAPMVGHPPTEVDIVVKVSRARQQTAIACHASQAVPGSILWHRLELLGDREYLRWQT